MTEDGIWFTETLYASHAQRLEMREIIYRSQTDQQDLLIFDNPLFGRVLTLDGVVQTTEFDEFIYHEMLAHVPILAHGSACDILIIGGGDGGMLRECLRHPVKRVTMVEIDRRVIELCRTHLPAISAGAFDDPRAHVVIADGARFVAEADEHFDVIIVDSTDPIGPGEVLFTEQFYTNCRKRLRTGGVLVTQSGAPAFEPDTLRSTWRIFSKIFLCAGAYLAPVPSYYGGFMAFGFATNDRDAFAVSEAVLSERGKEIQPGLRYYSPAMHRAAFVLPPCIASLAP